MGMDTPMAISNYLAGLLAMLFIYPFVLVGISIAIYSEQRRKVVISRVNLICGILTLLLFVFHMQTEVYYGKELLDAYYLNNSDKNS
ncbi:hypothetical protein ACQEXU_01705 [Vibrio sp. TRT 21S02]|uniref:hypothetical protein n=1 Tax=unclassified Vibrio TaxID=2614977 RepID=UPI00349F0CEC